MSTSGRHLLVTNDFPPKIGGIQSVLWESWRRLDPSSFAVLTSPHPDAAAFDREQPFRVERVPEFALLPHPVMVRRIRRLAEEFGADRVVLDPVFPLGLVGPRLGLPYDVVVHGAELTIPGRLPGTSSMIRPVLTGARRIIAFGSYPAAVSRAVARRDLDVAVIDPGVDVDRFRPLDPDRRAEVRRRLGAGPDTRLVLGISRLVRRKGFDTAIAAVARLAPDFPELEMVIAGRGRDEERLRRLAEESSAPVRFLGRVADADLADLYAAADLQVMLCRDRWWGLEQEGFGIVFVEAAAAGTPQLAGRSGGSADAVDHGVTGVVIDRPDSVEDVVAAMAALLRRPDRLATMSQASRQRAETTFAYGPLADRLSAALGDGPVI
ncbi:MAG: glycosyltransferase family 4 protein [Ilumatobacteraceae bacterium]